ncbi:TPA: major capsid protein, partial [Yersinia enterocolitica]|nr:major capsid protein [Yersinia enterocolitica]
MNIYDTNVLVGLVPNLKTSQNWLLDRFFPNVVTYATEEVSIDIDIGKRRMSPFVSPLVEGKLVESRKYQTNTFKPAYIKDKRAPDLRKPIRRQMGERIGGEYTAAEREMLNIQFEMEDQIDMLNRRMEWMAASALTKSQITVVGEGFPTTVIDFGRSSNLTITLSGSDKWPLSVAAGTTNTQPSDDIEDWQTLMLQESGAVATD